MNAAVLSTPGSEAWKHVKHVRGNPITMALSPNAPAQRDRRWLTLPQIERLARSFADAVSALGGGGGAGVGPTRTSPEIEQLVVGVRHRLVREGLFHGDQAILWELEDLGVDPLPSVRTIAHILRRHGVTRWRKGRYEPKGTHYPAPRGRRPGAVHQTDYVGPRHLKGPVRF